MELHVILDCFQRCLQHLRCQLNLRLSGSFPNIIYQNEPIGGPACNFGLLSMMSTTSTASVETAQLSYIIPNIIYKNEPIEGTACNLGLLSTLPTTSTVSVSNENFSQEDNLQYEDRIF